MIFQCCCLQVDCMYDSDHWWDKALEWSCEAGMSDKLMEAITMEITTMPSHVQVTVRYTDGLQYLLLEEVEKLEVGINMSVIGHLGNQLNIINIVGAYDKN